MRKFSHLGSLLCYFHTRRLPQVDLQVSLCANKRTYYNLGQHPDPEGTKKIKSRSGELVGEYNSTLQRILIHRTNDGTDRKYCTNLTKE